MKRSHPRRPLGAVALVDRRLRFITNRGNHPSHPSAVSNKRHARNVVPETTKAEAQFLRTELHTGLSFSKIALAAEDESKIKRNRTNARKAYDALLHFIPGAIISAEESKEINSQMAALKADLQKLGEDV